MKTKKLVVILICCIMVAAMFTGCGSSTDTVTEAANDFFANYPDEGNHMITATDLFAKIDAGDSMVIIDVRQADAYATGHLAGAINIPFGSTVAEDLKYITNDTPVYVYCYTGQTASQVTTLLDVAGIDATNIRGGYNNGISAADGYEAYVDTVEVAVPTTEYEVDSDIQAAITDYFTTTDANIDTIYKYNNISAADLKDAIDNATGEYFILSVRQAADYEAGHIEGAVNIPFGQGMEEYFADTLPTYQKIVVYCYTGHTASQTVAILRLLGYDAYNLSGGMGSVDTGLGWLGAGYDVVTD
jgi:rhodanese-related sulfurtransferase